jgi:hypothetical protein
VTDGDPGCDSQGSAQTGRAPGVAVDALNRAGAGDPSVRLASESGRGSGQGKSPGVAAPVAGLHTGLSERLPT